MAHPRELVLCAFGLQGFSKPARSLLEARSGLRLGCVLISSAAPWATIARRRHAQPWRAAGDAILNGSVAGTDGTRRSVENGSASVVQGVRARNGSPWWCSAETTNAVRAFRIGSLREWRQGNHLQRRSRRKRLCHRQKRLGTHRQRKRGHHTTVCIQEDVTHSLH